MAHESRIPRLGWSMEVGTFLGWRKQAGEIVRAGEPLFDLEGEQAVQEFEAIESAMLHIDPAGPVAGTEVPVGTLLGYLTERDEPLPCGSFDVATMNARAASESTFKPSLEKAQPNAAQPNALQLIGLAFDTDEGLLVPVLRRVPQTPLMQLARASVALVENARSGRLALEQLQGADFTVTNLGTFGIDAFTPVINLPEAAILGVGAIRREAILRSDDQIVAGLRLTLSLTFDHRLNDGAPAARFLADVRESLENPVPPLFADSYVGVYTLVIVEAREENRSSVDDLRPVCFSRYSVPDDESLPGEYVSKRCKSRA